jgi:protocatechuate 3,4-dioxygenase beta subunit
MIAPVKWKLRIAAFLPFGLLVLAACDSEAPRPASETRVPQLTGTAAIACSPTREDGEGPFYVPNAPERISVGIGHFLRGVVRSSRDCSPIAGARLEFWQTGPDAIYDDEHRATLYSDASGAYSFESNFPPGYSGRPPHIHVRVTVPDHKVLITQYYPQPGDTEGTFDLVLIPQP